MELQDVIEAQMILGKLSVGMVLAIAKDPHENVELVEKIGVPG
ncbi:hypothetical protein [Weissella sagaensis]|nr:hypothetical protein [Weissella sagaensis]